MTDSASRHNVTALFDHPSAAQDAATALIDAGFDKDLVKVQPGASEEVLRFERNQDPDTVPRGFITPDNGGALGFVAGFLGGGFLGLIMGSGSLFIMGQEAAVAVGPFWAAVIGAALFGVVGAFCGYTLNSPLPKLEPPQAEGARQSVPTIVSVATDGSRAQAAKDAIQHASPSRVTVWQASNGDWSPLAAN